MLSLSFDLTISLSTVVAAVITVIETWGRNPECWWWLRILKTDELEVYYCFCSLYWKRVYITATS